MNAPNFQSLSGNIIYKRRLKKMQDITIDEEEIKSLFEYANFD